MSKYKLNKDKVVARLTKSLYIFSYFDKKIHQSTIDQLLKDTNGNAEDVIKILESTLKETGIIDDAAAFYEYFHAMYSILLSDQEIEDIWLNTIALCGSDADEKDIFFLSMETAMNDCSNAHRLDELEHVMNSDTVDVDTEFSSSIIDYVSSIFNYIDRSTVSRELCRCSYDIDCCIARLSSLPIEQSDTVIVSEDIISIDTPYTLSYSNIVEIFGDADDNSIGSNTATATNTIMYNNSVTTKKEMQIAIRTKASHINNYKEEENRWRLVANEEFNLMKESYHEAAMSYANSRNGIARGLNEHLTVNGRKHRMKMLYASKMASKNGFLSLNSNALVDVIDGKLVFNGFHGLVSLHYSNNNISSRQCHSFDLHKLIVVDTIDIVTSIIDYFLCILSTRNAVSLQFISGKGKGKLFESLQNLFNKMNIPYTTINDAIISIKLSASMK